MGYLRPMNLALDFGNTRIKAGFFKGSELTGNLVFDNVEELIAAIPGFKEVENCIIGSVTNTHLPVQEALRGKMKTMVFAANTPIPIKNLYKSALTLGSDRIATSVGAWTVHPGTHVLTIDAGTCIKYNFVNAANEYLGGAISPGLPMRLKAMNHYTHALPLVETDKNFVKLIGQSTAESLLSGALVAAAAEVDGMIDRYRTLYPDLTVFITGGDADYLCKQVKNRFFADQNLLLKGLHTILTFNLEK